MSKTRELYEIVRLIRPVHRRLARAVEAKLTGSGITVGMRAVMEVLEETGPMSVPDIARALFLARQQVQLLVNTLEEQGMVERRPNPAHKRSPLFVLSDRGQSAFGDIRAGENDEMDAVCELFSDEDLQSTQRVLCAMLDHFAEFEDDPDRPKALEWYVSTGEFHVRTLDCDRSCRTRCRRCVSLWDLLCAQSRNADQGGEESTRTLRPNSAMLVIDVQEDFTRNTGKHGFDPAVRDAALGEINREIAVARESGRDVIFIKNIFRDWPVVTLMKLVARGIGTPGGEGLRIDRALDVGEAPVFEKSIGDTFSEPRFEAFLKDRNIGHLTLVGLDACHCVQLTAKGALARGYDVEIREPSILTATPKNWPPLKQELTAAGAVVGQGPS